MRESLPVPLLCGTGENTLTRMICPAPIRMICLLISALTALTALAGIVLGALDSAPFLIAFESVVLLASLFGVLAGAGKLRGFEAATMLCAGGTVFVAAVLSEPSVVTGLIQGGTGLSPTAAGVNLLPWIIFRFLMALGFFGLSGTAVVLRTPRASSIYLLRGVLVGLPVLVIGALAVAPGPRAAITSLSPPVLVFLASVGFLLIAALFSVSSQNLIRAFESGIEAGEKAALTANDEKTEPTDSQ